MNQLSPELQQLFLDQFLSLTPEHQEYVYQKFISAAPETQQFAIQQFLSLDHHILVVSIQAEIDREAALQRKKGKGFPTRNPRPILGKSPESEPLRNLQQFARKTTNIENLNPDNLSISELRSLQEQRQLEEQQQLQAIIETQHSLNQRG